jgi:trimethylamine--corrinoid protein Co-methyltransferase
MKTSDLKILSDSEIKEIHQHTLELLENTGIIVELKKMRDMLADQGCNVDEKCKIVKFPPAMVEEFVNKAPSKFILCGADPDVQWQINPEARVWAGLGTPFRMLDSETGERNEATLEDLRKHLK